MKTILTRLVTAAVFTQMVFQPLVSYSQTSSAPNYSPNRPTTNLSVTHSYSTPAPAPRPDVYQEQQEWMKSQRSKGDQMNPFMNPTQFQSLEEVENFIESGTPKQKYDFYILNPGNIIAIYDKSKPNEILGRFQLATQVELMEYSPKRFTQKLKEMAIQAKKAGKDGIHHTVMNMPAEVAIFYMSLGSLAALQLFTNFGANPAGGKLHNDQQLSPLGVTSLTMFLASQHATTNIASVFVKNPKWQTYLPYLGMTIGTAVQNYYTGVVTDPNLRACAKEILKMNPETPGAAEVPCEKAYEFFTLQKPWEFAPGLTSLLATTYVVGAGQQKLASAAIKLQKPLMKVVTNETAQKITQKALFRFAGFMDPAGYPFFVATGAWVYLTKYANLTLFSAIDHQLSHFITFNVSNLQENVSVPFAKSLLKTSNQLTEHLVFEKASNWNSQQLDESCKQDKKGSCSALYKDLDRFSEQMKLWRLVNMSEVSEAHQSWTTYLGNLVGQYNASKEFYKRFVSMSRNLIYEKHYDEKLLLRPFPFLGVKTDGTKEQDETYITAPLLPESEQLVFILQFKEKLLKLISDTEQKKTFLRDPEQTLFKEMKAAFAGNNGETREDKVKMGRGLQVIRKYVSDKATMSDVSSPLYQSLAKLFIELGNPEPNLLPGQGAIYAMLRSPTLQSLYQNAGVPKSKSLIRYNNLSEYFLTMMICGPDLEKGEKAVVNFQGFSADFLPPSLIENKSELKQYSHICKGMGAGNPELFFTTPVVGPLRLNATQKLATYASPFDFLKSNVRNSVLGSPGQEVFEDWWTRNTEAQMTAAFQDYQTKYQQIVFKLFDRFVAKDAKSNFRGTVANGLYTSMLQELRMNLLILGEILKDQYYISYKKSLPAPLALPEATQIPAALRDGETTPPLVKIMGANSFMDFDSIYSQYPNAYSKLQHTTKGLAPQRLAIQNEIEQAFVRMNAEILKMASGQSNGVRKLEPLNIAALEKVVKEVEELNSKFSALMGIEAKAGAKTESDVFEMPALPGAEEKKPAEKKTEQLVSLTPRQKRIAVKCLENIQSLAYESMNYGLIINTVNWESLQRKSELSEGQQQVMSRIQAIVEKAQPSLKIGK